ncbi:MAG: YegP family protein [Sulfurimonas sp.]
MEVILKKSEAAEPFTFRFTSDDKVIIKSENYKAKKSAENGIESVRKNSQDEARYELKEAKNGKFFFNLKATNGQVVGTSALFATEDERTDAIATLKSEAPNATLTDEV